MIGAMAYNIQLLKADITDELDKIGHVVNEFNSIVRADLDTSLAAVTFFIVHFDQM